MQQRCKLFFTYATMLQKFNPEYLETIIVASYICVLLMIYI